MPRPQSSLIQQFEARRAQVESDKTLFQADGDQAFLTAITAEHSNAVGGTIHLVPVTTERNPKGKFQTAGVDPLDGDILEPEFLTDPARTKNKIGMRCIILPEPEKQLLKKYGIDEQRDVAFFIPIGNIQAVDGLVSEWRVNGIDIGDLIFWDATWYQAWEVKRDHYFGQRDKALYIACFSGRYRQNAVPTEDVAGPEDPSEAP